MVLIYIAGTIASFYFISRYMKNKAERCDHDYESILTIEEDDVVLDVGAAAGCFAFPTSKRSRLVIAVEPNPIYFSKLEKKARNIDNIILVNKATWNEKGTRELIIDGYESSILNLPTETTIVETDTIDNIMNDLGFEYVDFIKMDIEGAEIETLQGSVNTLRNVKKIVVAGYHERKSVHTYIWVDNFLRSNGFNTVVTSDKLVHAWK